MLNQKKKVCRRHKLGTMIVVSYSLILYGKVFKWNREKRVKHTRNDSEAAKPKGQANFSHLEILSLFSFSLQNKWGVFTLEKANIGLLLKNLFNFFHHRVFKGLNIQLESFR